MSEYLNLTPEEAFPDEVVSLHEQDIPWPTWFAGPLYTGNEESKIQALQALEEIRNQSSAEYVDDSKDAPAEW